MAKAKKIAIIHYRVGGTDGVSLEIEKRVNTLKKIGFEACLIAGPRSQGAQHVVKELEWDNGMIPIIKENGFIHFNRQDLDAAELKAKINKVSRIIEDRLAAIFLQEKFDCCLVHNVFSFGGHIAAAKALAKWIKKFKIKTLATHHDFYWERKEYQTPRNEYLKNYLAKYMPPKSKYIEHAVINSLAQKELKKRSDIKAEVMPDVFDFSRPPWKADNFNKDLLKDIGVRKNDLVMLQATRVIPRKAIEISLDLAKIIQKKIHLLRSRRLYNGKVLGKKPKVWLIIAGYAEDEKKEYLLKLKDKALSSRINAKFIADKICFKRRFGQGEKTYSLWDAYAHADLVVFPSVWEGWGNQFIEAVFAKKPVMVHEYPVFRADIKKEGYRVISLPKGCFFKARNGLYKAERSKLKKASRQALEWLSDKGLNAVMEENFQRGKKYHDCPVLEEFLVKKLNLKPGEKPR